jgi:hypothetical protein
MNLLFSFSRNGSTSLQLQRMTYASPCQPDDPSDKIRFYRNFPRAGEQMDPLPQKRGSAHRLDKIGRLVQFLAARW